MKQGVIKYINRAKGYGFIKPTESNSKQGRVLFHANDVVEPSYKELRVNDKVYYIGADTHAGIRALDVFAYQYIEAGGQ